MLIWEEPQLTDCHTAESWKQADTGCRSSAVQSPKNRDFPCVQLMHVVGMQKAINSDCIHSFFAILKTKGNFL